MIQAKNPIATGWTPGVAAKLTSFFRRECIKFLIEVSETDPGELVSPERPGDVLNFAGRLCQFGLMRVVVMEELGAKDLADRIAANPKRALDPLITNIRSLLDAAADGKVVTFSIPPRSQLCFDAQPQRVTEQTLKYSPNWRTDRTNHLARTAGCGLSLPRGSSLPTQLAVFTFHAMRALDSEEGAMVRRCRRESCRKIFLAERPKQIFCTRKCAGAAAFERYKQNLGEEAYQAQHRARAKLSAKRSRAIKKRQQSAQGKIEVKSIGQSTSRAG